MPRTSPEKNRSRPKDENFASRVQYFINTNKAYERNTRWLSSAGDEEKRMFKLDEKVVYANYGVCVVSQVNTPMTFGGVERSYYVLTPTRKRSATVYVPSDHEELMRPIMTRAEALKLISSLASIQIDNYTDNNSRAVEDHFRKILRTNDCAAAAQVVKTMRFRIEEQREKHHAPSSMYARLLEQAEHQVRGELSAALDIQEDALDDFIARQTAQ